MNKQAILDVLNSLEVIEQDGGDFPYILVEDNAENRNKLITVGVPNERIDAVAGGGAFCILTLAFYDETAYADDYRNGKFIMWGPIDDELRIRVSNGEGTPEDALRLLAALETWSFGRLDR